MIPLVVAVPVQGAPQSYGDPTVTADTTEVFVAGVLRWCAW